MNRVRAAFAGAGVVMVLAATAAQSLAAGSSTAPQVADADTLASAVTAAEDFLALLNEDQRASTVFEFTDLDGKRSSWSNFEPSEFAGRHGARLGDLDDDQRAAAMTAVASVLSAPGYEYVQGMMAAEDELTSADPTPGSDDFYLAFYGEPSTDEPWTLQFGGHHLAIHISVGGEILSVSPYFQGVQPVSFEVDGTTVEPMATDTNSMFGLFESLDDEQLATAELTRSLNELVMGPQIDIGYPEPEGLPYTELTAEQQELVRAVISDWVADAAPGLAGPLLDVYQSQLDETLIGWSTSIDRDSAGYMRIDGPRVWIEWLNRDNPGESGFHPHTVYRDKLIDYGTGVTE